MKKIQRILLQLKNFDYASFIKETGFLAKFFMLVILYLFFDLLRILYRVGKKLPFIGKKLPLDFIKNPVKKIYELSSNIFNSRDPGEITSLDIINLAVNNLKAKKHRTIITIGGMAIGFGSVIFLLSIGYGVQKLVVSRVAKLDEMKQITVTTGQASSLFIDDKAIQDFSGIKHVESVLPLVSIVSKVEYNNSVSDAVAYGVTKEYLEQSAIQPSKGKIFDTVAVEQINAIPEQGLVAGVTDEKFSNAKMYQQFSQVSYSIHPLVWKPVYAQPSMSSEIIGYTQRVAGMQNGTTVWGEQYATTLALPKGIDYFDNDFLPWIKDSFPIWSKETCTKQDLDCIDGLYKIVKESGLQKQAIGFLTENDVTLSRYDITSQTGPKLIEGEKITDIQFSFSNQEYLPIYSEPDIQMQRTNLFTQASDLKKLYEGELVFGSSYADENKWGTTVTNQNGKKMGLWIRTKLPLFRKLDCTDCETLFLKEVDNNNEQIAAYTFIPAHVVTIDQLETPPTFGQVLGDATQSAQLTTTASDSAMLMEGMGNDQEVTLEDGTIVQQTQLEDGTTDWVTITGQNNSTTNANTTIVSFPDQAQKVALVNRALLNVLGLTEDESIGKTFTISLILDSDFFVTDYSAQSEPTEITIIGVIPEEKTPAYYMPFNDLKSLGINNYSQLRVIVNDQKNLKDVRTAIEAYGYKTTSVVDTVNRINSLFATIKIFLSILGLVALGVAALGMFNTLTVSLLEKTREVGLMKTIGMKSNEVKRLFLAESIIMGLSGGIFGLIIGSVSGNILSFLLSTISITKGAGYINLVDIPLFLALGIITLSFIIGVITGLYPAKRATKISALNALRYE